MVGFIDDHRTMYGVEPICRVLPRPLDVLSAQSAAGGSVAALGARPRRRGLAGDHSARVDRTPPGLWTTESVEADGTRRPPRGALPRPSADARNGVEIGRASCRERV